MPNCKICTDAYTDENGCRVPKTLHCSHSICLECATKSVVNNGIVCPFCRETTQLGPDGVQSLKKNFGLLEVIEDEKFVKNQMERELAHISPPRCPTHSYNLAEFVCINQECKSVDKLMCRTCEEFGDHKGHQKGLLQEECTRLRELMRKACGKLDDAEQKMSGNLQDLQKCRLTYSRNGKEYLDEVNRITMHFEIMRREVDAKEEETLQLLRDWTAKETEELDKMSNDIIIQLGDVNEKQVNLDQLMGLPNNDLLTKKSEVTQSCDVIDREPQFELFSCVNMMEDYVELPEFFISGSRLVNNDDE